jgi:hypothetical protein
VKLAKLREARKKMIGADDLKKNKANNTQLKRLIKQRL